MGILEYYKTNDVKHTRLRLNEEGKFFESSRGSDGRRINALTHLKEYARGKGYAKIKNSLTGIEHTL